MEKCSDSGRKALLGCLAVCLPPDCIVGGTASKRLLLAAAGTLKMKSGDVVEGMLPLLCSHNDIFSPDRMELIRPFLDIVLTCGADTWELCADVMAFLVRYGYDARARACAHNFCALMGLERAAVCGLEAQVAAVLRASAATADDSGSSSGGGSGSATGSKGSAILRYAQIGTVAVGTGALVAFTAGLAAPAIAAGLVMSGGTSGQADTL